MNWPSFFAGVGVALTVVVGVTVFLVQAAKSFVRTVSEKLSSLD